MTVRHAWPVAGIASAALLILVAACGGSPSSAVTATRAAQSADPSLLGFSRCMRSHGVPDFPDPQPGSTGKFPSAQQLGVSSSAYQAGVGGCQQLLPAGTDDQFPAAEVPLLLAGMREFSQCMRAHGVANWPDPITDSNGRPVFDLGAAGISRSDYQSPQVQSKLAGCQHLLPAALGGNTPVGGS